MFQWFMNIEETNQILNLIDFIIFIVFIIQFLINPIQEMKFSIYTDY